MMLRLKHTMNIKHVIFDEEFFPLRRKIRNNFVGGGQSNYSVTDVQNEETKDDRVENVHEKPNIMAYIKNNENKLRALETIKPIDFRFSEDAQVDKSTQKSQDDQQRDTKEVIKTERYVISHGTGKRLNDLQSIHSCASVMRISHTYVSCCIEKIKENGLRQWILRYTLWKNRQLEQS